MSRSHINSDISTNNAHPYEDLPLKNLTKDSDANTKLLAHYDISPNDISGIRPYDVYVDDSTVLCFDMSNIFVKNSVTYIWDKSKYGNFGRVSGATLVNGRNGKAMKFDANQLVEIERPRNTITDTLTLEAWIYPTGVPTGDRGFILAQSGGFYLTMDTTYHVSTYWYGKAPAGYHTSTATLTLNTWNHIVVTWDATTHNIYINGTLDKTLAVTGTGTISNNKVCIGNENGSRQYFGLVNSAAILARAVTADEVKQRYNGAIYGLTSIGRGKYGGAMTIQESTVNLLATGTSDGVDPHTWSGRVGVTTEKSGDWVRLKTTNATNLLRGNVDLSLLANGTTYALSIDVYNDTYKDQIIRIDWCDSIMATETIPPGVSKRISVTGSRATYDSTFRFFDLSSSAADTDILIRNPQVEAKSFSTSFINGAREQGKLIYPVTITGDFTTAFWCKFDYKWYASITSYNKKLIRFSNSSGQMITFTDYAGTLNTGFPFFDLETNALWDAVQHHWHQTFNYETDRWYYIVFVKSGSTMKLVIYDDVTKAKIEKVWTYTESTKFADFAFNEITFFGEWNASIDELRIDSVARTDDEILAWFVSNTPFAPRGDERLVY